MAGGEKTQPLNTQRKNKKLHVREANFDKNVLDLYYKIEDLQWT